MSRKCAVRFKVGDYVEYNRPVDPLNRRFIGQVEGIDNKVNSMVATYRIHYLLGWPGGHFWDAENRLQKLTEQEVVLLLLAGEGNAG